MEETIVELHRAGFKLGLISNGRSPFQEHNFKALGLSEYFSSIIVSEAVGWRKPQVEIFLLACQQLNVLAEQCVFVGDSEMADIQGAKHAGMKAVFFHPDLSRLSVHADISLHHFSELPLWLSKQ